MGKWQMATTRPSAERIPLEHYGKTSPFQDVIFAGVTVAVACGTFSIACPKVLTYEDRPGSQQYYALT